jgi:tyrosine decarboxylase/aspartate 1-decarboxylase
MEFLETNLGDPEHFQGAWEMEKRLLEMIEDLLHAPRGAGGEIVSGGTEGNLIAMLIAKHLKGKREIIIPEHAHFSFKKIANIMDLKLRIIDTSDTHTMEAAQVKRAISNKTAAVVAIAGSTELGLIDPIEEIAELCREEHQFLHVDAAFGGFILPFLKDLGYDLPSFDFAIEGVCTISIDAHKIGCSAIPLGIIVARNRRWLEDISVDAPYVSRKKQVSLISTRSGGPVAAAYAVINYLGREGYQKIAGRCMETTYYAKRRIEEIGLDLVSKPVLNILGIRVKNLNEVVKGLLRRGWYVNPIERLSSFRVVLMPHITKQIIDEFVPDLEDVCREVGEI